MSKQLTRRTFLMGAALTAAGCATGRRGRRAMSPNEKLNVAAIGAGGKGHSDIMGAYDEGANNVVALCDVDWNQAAKAFERFPSAAKFKDYREMLDKMGNEIDAVTISTPDHMHAPAALACMEMGKHVYVQKPLTHTVEEARMLQKAARRYGVATQMGNQGHCGEGVRQMCEMVWDGIVGDIHEAHVWTNRPIWPQGMKDPLPEEPVPDYLDWDLWLGVAPYRPYNKGYCPFNWRGWWDYGTGALGDMACHIMDPANWALKLGAPTSVECIQQEGMTEQSPPIKSVIKYEFPARHGMPPVAVYWYDGGLLPERPEGLAPDEVLGDGDNGSFFVGEKGILSTGTYGGKSRLVPAARAREYTPPAPSIPRVPGNDSYKDWIRACKGGEPACSNFDYACPFTEVVLLGNVAMRVGQKIEWDAKNMRITNVPEANALITKSYRPGWGM